MTHAVIPIVCIAIITLFTSIELPIATESACTVTPASKTATAWSYAELRALEAAGRSTAFPIGSARLFAVWKLGTIPAASRGSSTTQTQRLIPRTDLAHQFCGTSGPENSRDHRSQGNEQNRHESQTKLGTKHARTEDSKLFSISSNRNHLLPLWHHYLHLRLDCLHAVLEGFHL